MPVTPFHLGPAAIIKAVLREKFSITIFGFSQILMDLQPLFAMLGADIELHGLSHTYLGATGIGIVASLLAKPVCEFLLRFWNRRSEFSKSNLLYFNENISWTVTISSAFIGTYSHIFLDSFMHADLQPFYPLEIKNQFLGLIGFGELHVLCVITGVIGAMGYFSVEYFKKNAQK